MAKTKTETLDADDIIVDQEFQMRVDGLDLTHVQEIAEEIEANGISSFERLTVFRVAGIGDILTQGFHRHAGCVVAKVTKIPCVVTEGTLLDATLSAAQGRGELGKKWEMADRVRAVDQTLARLKAANEDWSSRKIAETLKVLRVSKDLVEERRKLLEPPPKAKADAIVLDEPEREEPKKTRTGKDGKQYPVPSLKAKDVPIETAPSTDSVDWKTFPLEEFLDVDDFVWEAIKRSQVKTAGDMLDRIVVRGEKFSLPRMEIEEIRRQIEAFRDANEAMKAEKPKPEKPKPQGAVAGFNWEIFDTHYGYVARGPDDIATLHPALRGTQEIIRCQSILKEFRELWTILKGRIEGKKVP